MRRVGGGFGALLVWLALVAVPVVALPGDACAAEEPRAALVVDTGEGAQRFCVSLPTDEVSGLELIALAGEQHGLSYRFGYGGAAVCMLADVGTTGDDCFERYPDFWGYWRGSGGSWTWSSTGAGNTTVTDGDVEGWSWGSGSDGSTHPRPPETHFSSVCPLADEPEDEPSGAAGGAAPSAGDGERRRERPAAEPRPASAATSTNRSGRGPATEPRTGETRPEPKPRKGRHLKEDNARFAAGRTTATPSPQTVLVSDDVVAVPERRSVPPTGLVALGLAGALGMGGFVIARRRRGRA